MTLKPTLRWTTAGFLVLALVACGFAAFETEEGAHVRRQTLVALPLLGEQTLRIGPVSLTQ